jgi:hypothetical protein
MDRMEEATKEMVMTDFLPNTSDKEPAIKMLMDKAIVVEERLKLETAGETWNSFDRSGNNGCVPQSIAKVLKPPANKARAAILKLRVPR